MQRIWPEKATKMLEMLVNGRLSIESFINRTDEYIAELKHLTSELAVKAFTDTLVEILGYDKQMDNDYADIQRGDQLILKEEFHALYNTDQPNASDEDIAFVDKLYARIKECDLHTFPYKF